MAFYLLVEDFELCGWKKLPFALRHIPSDNVEFLDKECFEVLLSCDGKHNINVLDFTKKQKELFERILERKVIEESDGEKTLLDFQKYKYYPNVYKSHVQWSITGYCNYRCKHCFMSAPQHKFSEPSLQQSLYILDELENCGIRQIGITGGEPLVCKNFWDIVSTISKKKMFITTIYTNGKLVNDELLDKLEALNLHPAFQLSFDGVGWHDWLRGVKGAEEEVISAFKLLQKRGYTTTAAMCLHKHNIETLRESVNLLDSLGCKALKVNVATASGNWANEKEHFITNDEAYEYMLDYIPYYFEDKVKMNLQLGGMFEYSSSRSHFVIPFARFANTELAKNKPSCGAIKKGMYISPEGMVLPCMTMAKTAIEKEFDCIYDLPLDKILSDSSYCQKSYLKMGEVIDHNCKCKTCKYKYICGGGCRALACGEDGEDYLALDNEACEFFSKGYYERIIDFVIDYDKKHNTNIGGMNSLQSKTK